MRILYVLFVVVLLKVLAPDDVAGQVQHVLYYDDALKVTEDKTSAKFVELIERENNEAINGTISYYKVVSDTADYLLVRKGSYSSVFHPRKVHGQLVSYFPNGKRQSLQNYNNGVLALDIEWHDNDSIRHTIAYKDGKLDGDLKTYYKSGKLKREELYKSGKQTYGKCYAEDGKEITFVPYREMPVFPGGEGAMFRYLGQNIRYPAISMRSGIGGMVVVSFTVKTDGSIEDIRVLKSINDELDNEAIRVVKRMPTWTPGKLEGEVVDVRYSLPVKYTIM